MDDELVAQMQRIQEANETEALGTEINSSIISRVSMDAMERALNFLRAGKPPERGEESRRYAVTITELEKVVAYFKVYVVDA